MIIFQIIAGLLLVPLTAVMFILFNIYSTHWIYLAIIISFAIIYSLLCGLVFSHFSIVTWVFISLCLLYLVYQWRAKKITKCPLLHGKIKTNESKFKINFLVRLSILNSLKLLPNKVSQELTRKTGLSIEISKLVDMVLESSRGACIDIKNEDEEIYLEIK